MLFRGDAKRVERSDESVFRGGKFEKLNPYNSIRVLPRVVTSNLVGNFRNPRVYVASFYSLSVPFLLLLSSSLPLFLALFFAGGGGKHAFCRNIDEMTLRIPPVGNNLGKSHFYSR